MDTVGSSPADLFLCRKLGSTDPRNVLLRNLDDRHSCRQCLRHYRRAQQENVDPSSLTDLVKLLLQLHFCSSNRRLSSHRDRDEMGSPHCSGAMCHCDRRLLLSSQPTSTQRKHGGTRGGSHKDRRKEIVEENRTVVSVFSRCILLHKHRETLRADVSCGGRQNE